MAAPMAAPCCCGRTATSWRGWRSTGPTWRRPRSPRPKRPRRRGGEAHGHRHNPAPIVAHRRFACSINLNSEEFEGGGLRYPEYGDQQYRPATGEAIVFSSSILHEVMHVTAGRRYVLLAFLYGDV